MPGNACERRRWRMQRADLGAAVEKTEGKRQPEDFFGHRKRGCEATSSPSAHATGKALKPLGFRAFSLLFSRAAYGLLCRIGGRKSRVDFPSGGIRLKRFRLLHHQYTIKILAPAAFQPEFSLFSAYISNPSVIPFSLAVFFHIVQLRYLRSRVSEQISRLPGRQFLFSYFSGKIVKNARR